jgi:hypothetical protein
MENKKSKEDIQFEKDMEIIKKGGRTATYEELDFSKSGNPLPKKTPKMEKKKSERDREKLKKRENVEKEKNRNKHRLRKKRMKHIEVTKN